MEIGLTAILDGEQLNIGIAVDPSLRDQVEYAFYLMKDGKRVSTVWYSQVNEQKFQLDTPGVYYITCFVRDKVRKNAPVCKHSQLFHYPNNELYTSKQDNHPKALMERPFEVNSKLNGNILSCEIRPVDNGFGDLEFAFYLMNQFQKVSSVSYSPYNRMEFELDTPGIYAVRCFVKQGNALIQKLSSFHRYKIDISPVDSFPVNFSTPDYLSYEYPYTDFCLILSPTPLRDDVIKHLKEKTGLFVNSRKWEQSYIYKIGKESILESTTILSGIINEGTHFIFGQKDINLLNKFNSADTITMSGKFMLYQEESHSLTVTCDYFGSNSVFYYWDGVTAIVANRLNLVLYVLGAMSFPKKINSEYISAILSFGDGMISGTNFSSELAIKNLYVLPVNQYIQISLAGLQTITKPINYNQISYNEPAYKELLQAARKDINTKLNNIVQCPDITHYKISLSGGFDSRLNLAALLNNKDALELTSVTTRDVPTANDLQLSLQLTNHYGLTYVNFADYNIQYDWLNVDDFILRYRNFNNGIYHTINQLPGICMTSDYDNRTINYIGAFGETMRSHYYMNTRRFIEPDSTLESIIQKVSCRLAENPVVDFNNDSFL